MKTQNYLYKTDIQNPHMTRAIAVREMPNLQRGVALALAAGEVATAVTFANRITRFLDTFGRWRERDALLEKVSKVAGGKAAGGAITKVEFLIMSGQGDSLLQGGQAQQAEALFRDLLARLEVGAAYDDQVALDYDMAMTQMSIGRCLAAQGWPLQAIPYHQKAINGFEYLSQDNNSAKKMMGVSLGEMAGTLMAIGQFDKAQKSYEASLPVFRDVDDKRSLGVTHGQLGTLAMRRGDLAAAQKRYQAALDTFRALNEPQMEAVAWHQLGRVAQEARQWTEAERCYRESLRIKERQQDWLGVAKTCNQLARVAMGDGRFADAERWYLRAQEIKDQVAPQDASTLSNLANLYLTQNRLAEAENYARRALTIVETLDLSAEPWKTYGILAQIAAAQGQTDAAARWRRKEQESYAAYAGASHQMQQYQPIITAVVDAAQGKQKAITFLESEFPKMEQGSSEWTQNADAFRKIIAGEDNLDALTTNLGRTGALIVRTILQQLSGEVPPQATPPPQKTPTAEPAGVSLGDFLNSLLNGVVAACQPDAPSELHPQLQAAARGLASDPAMPEPVQALGATLLAILNGERQPDLSALPPELADAVQQLLAQIPQ